MRMPTLPRPRVPKLRRPRRPEARGPRREGGLAGSLARGARSVAYAGQDLLHVLGRVPRAIASGLRGFWMGMSLRTRQRLALTVIGAVALVLLTALVVPALPCQFPGGDVCAPPDDAQEIVPADALGYVHLSLDPEGEGYRSAVATAESIPGITQQVLGRLLAQLPGPGGQPADFDRDVAPWFGGQAAVAIIPRAGGAEQVQLLEEGDSDGAAAFAGKIASGSPAKADYEGVEVSVDDRGLATASVGGFLAIGTDGGVRSLIDVSAGAQDSRSLSSDPVVESLREALPPERFVTAYLSKDGIEQLVASPKGALSSLEPFVDSTSSEGLAASLGASDDAFTLALRSSLDPEREETSPGFFAAFPAFEPQLPERLATDTLAYVGIADPARTVAGLLAQATAQAPALAEGLTAAVDRVRRLGRVDVRRELFPALGGEAAFALQPGPGATPEPAQANPPAAPEGLPGGPLPIPAGDSPVPVVQFLAEGVDSDRAREALARLQGPVSKALDPGTSFQAPVFGHREVDGVGVEVLRLGPTLNLAYALDEDRLAAASQPAGVEDVIRGRGGLAGAASFERATEGFGDELSMLVYLDLAGLVKLGEREGLAESPAYAAYASEFRTLEALGVGVEAHPDSIATDVRLAIDPGADAVEGEGKPPTE